MERPSTGCEVVRVGNNGCGLLQKFKKNECDSERGRENKRDQAIESALLHSRLAPRTRLLPVYPPRGARRG